MRRNSVFAALAVFLVGTLVLAHPHLQKTVTAKLDGGAEVTIQYFTSPANEDHAKTAEVGAFNAGAIVKIGTDLMVGGETLKAGEYMIGAIKQSDNSWVMGLHEGRIGRDQGPDMAKVTKLDSEFSTKMGMADHVLFDIVPGHGKMAGKPTIVWHFGSLYLAGALG